MHKLQFVDGSRDSVWLVEPKVTIGKNAANDVVLNSPGLTDFHAEILVDKDTLYLVNLNARNICKINGKLVPVGAPLNTNDVVELDQISLRVVDPKNEPKANRAAPAPTTADADAWYLEGNASWMTQKTFPLKGSMTIGRDADCQLSFPVSHLSRRHAQLTLLDGCVVVKDLDSTNGTFINGERVTEGKARPGDKIRFDVVTFVLHGPQVKVEAPAKAFAADDGNKTVLRRAAPIKPAAPEAGAAADADAAKKPRASRPVPNLMTAASKPAPKLSTRDTGKKSHWPLIAGAIVLVLVALSVVFLMK